MIWLLQEVVKRVDNGLLLGDLHGYLFHSDSALETPLQNSTSLRAQAANAGANSPHPSEDFAKNINT